MEQFLLLGDNPVTGWLNNMLHRFLLWIDSCVYKLVSMCYQLFIYLSSVEIFTQDFFKNFALRIYAILGVFMLFYLAYALLNAIIDPDKGITGEKGVGKIAFNLVKALVLLGLLPTIFSYAMRIQNFILSENIIGTIILGTSKEDTNDILVTFGDNMSYKVLNAFINPEEYNFTLESGVPWSYAVNNFLLGTGDSSGKGGDYSWLPELAPAVTTPQQVQGVGSVTATYLGVISSIAGGFLIYIILSFCLDLGVRVVKLAYCQLIAPIPIVLSIIPSKKSVMDKWVKLTISTYFEVFVRVGIMYLVAYFMSKFFTNNTILDSWGNGMVGKFGMVVIILGLFAFAKQLPKLISDTLGIDSGNIKLGIGEKLKASGPLGNIINTSGKAFGGAVKGLGLGVAGATTGALGAAWTAKVNGGQIGNALLYGGLQGFKGKGMQFNAQRKGLYEKYGLKGPAGWLGGRALLPIWADRIANTTQNQFAHPETGANTKWIKAVEDTPKYKALKKQVQDDFYKKRQAINDARQPYMDDIAQYNADISDAQAELEEIKNIKNSTRQKIINDKIQTLMESRNKATKSDEVLKLNQQIQELSNGIISNDLQSQINSEISDKLAGKREESELNTAIETARSNIETKTKAMEADDNVAKAIKEFSSYQRKIDSGLSEADIINEETISKYGKIDPEFKDRAALRQHERDEIEINTRKRSLDYQTYVEAIADANKRGTGSVPNMSGKSGNSSGGSSSGGNTGKK